MGETESGDSGRSVAQGVDCGYAGTGQKPCRTAAKDRGRSASLRRAKWRSSRFRCPTTRHRRLQRLLGCLRPPTGHSIEISGAGRSWAGGAVKSTSRLVNSIWGRRSRWPSVAASSGGSVESPVRQENANGFQTFCRRSSRLDAAGGDHRSQAGRPRFRELGGILTSPGIRTTLRVKRQQNKVMENLR